MPESLAHGRHDPLACSSCEGVVPTQWRRYWKIERSQGAWHYLADGPDLMTRLPKAAHFLTILAYLPGPADLPAHYRGPFYCEGDAAHPADVLRDIRRCVELLGVEYDLPAAAIRLWLSGGRSVHLTIPPHVIGAAGGHPLLPDIYKTMIEALFPKAMAPTMDLGIYSRGKGRMWRLPNRWRMDTGKCKVPISVSECLHKPYPELEALPSKPRRGVFWPAENDLDPCPTLVQLYHQVREQVEAAAVHAAVRHDARSYGSYQDGAGVLFHLFSGRNWVHKALPEGKGWSVTCPWSSAHTKGTPGDTSSVIFRPRPGDELGYYFCSHMHCEGRTIHEVLALFSDAELIEARTARGLRTITAAELIAQGYRTVAAAEVMPWRR